MINLSLSILFTSSLVILFKYFERFRVNLLHAIVINYFVAGTAGMFFAGSFSLQETLQQPWLKIAVPLGLLFISVFYTISVTTVRLGVSAAIIANKMSVIIPVSLAFLLFDEKITWLKTSGILLALLAVYMTGKKEKRSESSSLFYLPLLVFAGSGIIDSLVNYSQQVYIKDASPDLFLSTAFYSAGLCGACIVLYHLFFPGKRMETKSIIAGIILGIPNYFSIYFLMKALSEGFYESSIIFPANNIGIVLVSVLYSYAFLKEKISPLNWSGIVIAVFSLLLMNSS